MSRQSWPQQRTQGQIDEAQRYIDAVLGPLCGHPVRKRGLKLRPCPAHNDPDPSLSINTGDIVAIRWKCFGGCDPGDIRDAFIARGADPRQLGSYGTPKWQREQDGRSAETDPELVADAKRWRASRKLPRDLNVWQVWMCLQALDEGDGNLPGDPFDLIGVDEDHVKDLAVRSGMLRAHVSRAWKQWLDYEAKLKRRRERIKASGEQ